MQLQNLETTITKNDVLQIGISTPDGPTTQQLNAPVSLNAGGAVGGYLVDETGIIKLPLLGPVKAGGLTKRELAALITEQLLEKKLAKDPIVTVRITNYKITVLGEVGHPGVISVPDEHMTLPQALAEAGDLTAFGKRENVLLIREVAGKRLYKRFSLNNDQLFDKEIYNLQNQDIIYVQPNNARAAQSDRFTTAYPLAISMVSILLVLYINFVRK
jgi:polysaccharide export outer membrane protein